VEVTAFQAISVRQAEDQKVVQKEEGIKAEVMVEKMVEAQMRWKKGKKRMFQKVVKVEKMEEVQTIEKAGKKEGDSVIEKVVNIAGAHKTEEEAPEMCKIFLFYSELVVVDNQLLL